MTGTQAGTTPGAPQGYRDVEIDDATEKRVVRKIDRRLVTLAFLCYLVAFLDRSNIGNAETAGMSKDLGFDDAKYQWLLTIFYIPYILFEWFAVMWKIVPPHIWAFGTVFTWGVASILQTAVFNWAGLMVCRWFLAMAEAGFGPGMPYLFSFFYSRQELGVRCGIFLSAAPLATTFAGALAYGITSGHTAIPSWRLLFLVEGIPPIILSFVVFFMLPDSPDKARFLSPEEKEVARARAIQQTGVEGEARRGGIELKQVLEAFKTPQTVIQALMYFSCNVSFSSLPVFLPTILTTMGFTSIDAQGLTAPPYFVAFIVCILSTWIADKTRQRGLMIAGLSIMGCAGYVMLAVSHSVGVRYTGVFLAAAGVFPAIANILPWSLNNQGSDTKRGVGIAVLNIIGQCGPLLGTRLFPAGEKPYYVKGMAVCAAFMFFNAFLAISLRTYFVYKNKQADKMGEAMAVGLEGKATVDEMEKPTMSQGAEEGGSHPTHSQADMEGTVSYRYML